MILFLIKLLFQIAFLVIFSLLAYLVYAIAKATIQIQRFRGQGVVYASNFPAVQDFLGIVKASKESPYKQMLSTYTDPVIAQHNRPAFLGCYLMGINFILVNDPDLLEEIYVKKNALFTKHPSKREGGAPLVYNNIVSMDTHHPAYAPKRRALSSAFFKGKVQ